MGEALIGGRQRGVEMQSHERAERRAGAKDRIRIDIVSDLAGDVGFAGRAQRFGNESRFERFVRKDGRIIWGRLMVSMTRDAAGRPQFPLASFAFVGGIDRLSRTQK